PTARLPSTLLGRGLPTTLSRRAGLVPRVRARRARRPGSARLAQLGARLAALDALCDQPLDLGVALDPQLPALVRLPPVGDPAVLRELVEVRARDRQMQALIVGVALAHLRAGNLDPVELRVATALELQAEDELELAERRDLLLEALDGLGDDLARGSHERDPTPRRLFGGGRREVLDRNARFL